MKLNKLLLLMVLATFTFSCSQDANEDQLDTTTRLAADQFDDSHLGEYKGVFTTVDGLTRGHVVVTLSPKNEGTAQIILSSGEVIELQSLPVKLTADNTVSNLRFSSLGLSSTEVELDFSVEANGLNPMISKVSFDNKESEIAIAKNLARAPATTLVGTYDCTNCGEIGVGFPNGRTWSVITSGLGGNQTYTVQIAYDRRIYNAKATQAGCTTNPFAPGITFCTISGSASILGFNLSFAGSHSYPTSNDQTCSNVDGTWSAPGFGSGAVGTFSSNGIQCN